MSSTDLCVIGGGIGGLYLAWRLRDSGLKIVLLEKSERLGGRMYSVGVPGGFKAEMGAMRYLPKSHLLLQHLIDHFSLETEPLFVNERGLENKISHYWRNKHVNQQQLEEMHNIRKSDEKYYPEDSSYASDLLPNPNGNLYQSAFSDGRQAKDMNKLEYISRSRNAQLLNFHYRPYPNYITMADLLSFKKSFSSFGETGYITLKNGMESLSDKLVTELVNHPNVKLLTNHNVLKITETVPGFEILFLNSGHQDVLQAEHCLIACNSSGLKSIRMESRLNRERFLWSILDQYVEQSAFKLFLTYRSAWWEESGFYSGVLRTDLPIGEVISFGDRAKRGGYCTLLTCFTYRYQEIFDGLTRTDIETDDRMQDGIIPQLKPSRRLVDYVHDQLKLIFGRSSIPDPVFGLTKFWNDDIAANYKSQIGNDASRQQWKALKPFSDINLYMTGDTAYVIDHKGAFFGWIESALINSERIVVNYFNKQPILNELSPSLHQPSMSKL